MTQSDSLLLISGGQQKDRLVNEWRQYKSGILLTLNPATRQPIAALDYVSPPEVCPDQEPSILFKCGALHDGRLCLCTSTEVLIYKFPELRLGHTISIPCFNDLHHALPAGDGRLLVANTGLDMLVEVTVEGELLRQWSALGEDPWQRFSRDTDYRKVSTTKPHASHPNFVFTLGEDIWITRFQQMDAISVTRPGARIEFGRRPHDGIFAHGRIYFTTVDGYVFVVNQETLATEHVANLNEMDDRKVELGWCRGILPLDQNRCWIGFSRLRPTRFQENVSWLRHGFKQLRLPTRIALYDLAAKTLITEIDLEPFGVNAVFSILPAPCIQGC